MRLPRRASFGRLSSWPSGRPRIQQPDSGRIRERCSLLSCCTVTTARRLYRSDMAAQTLDEPRSHRARTILRLAREDTPRTQQELAEAAGVSRQYVALVLRRYAPHVRTRGKQPPAPAAIATCAWCGYPFEQERPSTKYCSVKCAAWARVEIQRARADHRGDAIGQRAYAARRASPATPWREIAAEVGAASAHSAHLGAKHYAIRRALPWPIRKGRVPSAMSRDRPLRS